MSDDSRIQTFAMDELNPSHIHLRTGRASPLASLEDNHTDRFIGKTHILKLLDEETLRIVEVEFGCATFLSLDIHEARTPEREIVLNANANKSLDDGLSIDRSDRHLLFAKEFGNRLGTHQLLDEWYLLHRNRIVSRGQFLNGEFESLIGWRANPKNRIERSIENGVKVGIVGEYVGNRVHIQLGVRS